MPVTVELRENGHIVYLKFTDPWSIANLTAAYKEELPFYDNAAFKVHSLLDLTQAHRLPPGMMNGRQGSPALFHANRGVIVVIGANRFMQALANTSAKIVRYDGFRFFEKLDEGWDFLRGVIAGETANETSG
jgi:hypothetical protein